MERIRAGVFETNSSSVHSLSICSNEEYNEFKEGKRIYESGSLIPTPEDFCPEANECDETGQYTYEDFWEHADNYDDSFEEQENIKGVDVMVFGYYGYN